MSVKLVLKQPLININRNPVSLSYTALYNYVVHFGAKDNFVIFYTYHNMIYFHLYI